MKHLFAVSSLTIAAGIAAATLFGAQRSGVERSPIYGVTIPVGYRNWEAGNSYDHPYWSLFDTEHVSKQIRHRIRYPRLVNKVPRGCNKYSQPHDASDSVKRTEVFFRCRKCAQRRGVSGIPPRFDVEFFSQPAEILGLVIDDRKHSTKKQ